MLKRHKVVMPLATELGLVAQWQGNSRELAQELAAAGVHLPYPRGAFNPAVNPSQIRRVVS